MNARTRMIALSLMKSELEKKDYFKEIGVSTALLDTKPVEEHEKGVVKEKVEHGSN